MILIHLCQNTSRYCNLWNPSETPDYRISDRALSSCFCTCLLYTSNLDSASGREVIQIIEELNRQGRTVILITHDNTIAASAHRIIRLQDGRVVDDHVSQPSDALGAG